MTQSGRFISIEGGDGSGKSTQGYLLYTALLDAGMTAIYTREPGGTPGASAIRQLLISGEHQWDAMSELLLVNAARHDHVERVIRPALKDGAWVVCDRYIDSTVAYQGAAGGIETKDIFNLHTIATRFLMPDLTLVIDVPVDVAMERVRARGTLSRFEAKGIDYHQRVREGFRKALHWRRAEIVDGVGSISEVHARVVKVVESRFDVKLSAACAALDAALSRLRG